jgi:hypothetical protein
MSEAGPLPVFDKVKFIYMPLLLAIRSLQLPVSVTVDAPAIPTNKNARIYKKIFMQTIK